MRIIFLFAVGLSLAGCQQKQVQTFEVGKDRVVVTTLDGVLAIHPLADNAVRVQYYEGEVQTLPEFVLTTPREVPEFTVTDRRNRIRVTVDRMSVEVNKRTAHLSFTDHAGKVFLSEMAGSRIFTPDSVMGEPCSFVEVRFDSPADESLFGLGQFQDGHFNLRQVSRRLTQVNSQIAIPFIYSSRGFGLLWHQYGLTDFNPADNFISLEKQGGVGQGQMVEVTTTSGTQRVAQDQTLYKGTFTVPEAGLYSIFLDLGGMGNRHYVLINGNPVIDQSNLWLPPTAGALVHLEAGEHEVQLVCRTDNAPRLSWRLADNTTTFRSPHAQKMDYVVFYGPSADKVISTYRDLTGHAPMFPVWAFGFWQCRERYTSGQQLVDAVRGFRDRDLPVDVIVQDWQYWGPLGWGVPIFYETHYPDPAGFIREIHDLNAHFAVSIWSNPCQNSELGRAFARDGHFIPNTRWLDYFNPATREAYWNTLYENMFTHGVDVWWMDAIEPENDALRGTLTHIGPGYFYRLIYPLMVSKAVHEGQRATTSDKRVCILTRSAFPGQQRYGTIKWSGDVAGTWDGYRRQIVAGLNFTITGLPYWTTDIGGFFRPGMAQYTDVNFHELLTRWFQWSALKPIFRMHGYQSETEPWKYGQTVEENMRKMLNLRYRLLPYIYSEAWQVTSNGSTMMRPLVMDFREDRQAVAQPHQYMFGEAILVAPITEPGRTDWEVYLPEAPAWYNFWTGQRFEGGQTVLTDAPLNLIPLYVRAGSIIPMGPAVQFAGERPADAIELRVYPGANGEFTLYEDEGNNYNYEQGAYSTITFAWNDTARTLTIGERQGQFPGMLAERKFRVVRVEEGKGTGMETPAVDHEVVYTGEEVVIEL